MIARSAGEIVGIHVGRPALVIGGGMSAPAQAARAPAEAIRISANQHGFFIGRVDYVVACDDLERKELRGPSGKSERIRAMAKGAPIISIRRSIADIHIVRVPINNSGITACWVAWLMGCAPILTAGMDCFVDGTYFHDKNAQSSGRHIRLEAHLHKWQRFRDAHPGVPIRPLGGPTEKLYPPYDPAESGFPAPDLDALRAQVRGHWARVLKRFQVGPYPFEPPAVVELTEGEFEHGMKKRAIEPALGPA